MPTHRSLIFQALTLLAAAFAAYAAVPAVFYWLAPKD